MIVITIKKLKINEKDLCRKYRTNVHKLIRSWKQGLSDSDIANATGINPATLGQIREDIELTHRHLRLTQKKELFRQNKAGGQFPWNQNPFFKD